MGNSKGLAIASLILGIASVCTGYIFVGVACGIVAIILSAKSKQAIGPNGMATAGLVLGIIGVVYGIPVSICYVICGIAANAHI